MKNQITPAAVALMASGRKIALLAMLSYLTRSSRTAISSPTPTVISGSSTTQTRVLTRVETISLLPKNHS